MSLYLTIFFIGIFFIGFLDVSKANYLHEFPDSEVICLPCMFNMTIHYTFAETPTLAGYLRQCKACPASLYSHCSDGGKLVGERGCGLSS